MENQSISEVLQRLIDQHGCQVKDVADATGINKDALYSILRRQASRADMGMLKTLADYFDEDLDVFCGRPDYVKKPRLSQPELELLSDYRSLVATDQVAIRKLAKQPPRPMTQTQTKILELSSGLNDKGQARLLESCEDLIASNRYL